MVLSARVRNQFLTLCTHISGWVGECGPLPGSNFISSQPCLGLLVTDTSIRGQQGGCIWPGKQKWKHDTLVSPVVCINSVREHRQLGKSHVRMYVYPIDAWGVILDK